MDMIDQLRRLSGVVEGAGKRTLEVDKLRSDAERQLSEAQNSLRDLRDRLADPSSSKIEWPAAGVPERDGAVQTRGRKTAAPAATPAASSTGTQSGRHLRLFPILALIVSCLGIAGAALTMLDLATFARIQALVAGAPTGTGAPAVKQAAPDQKAPRNPVIDVTAVPLPAPAAPDRPAVVVQSVPAEQPAPTPTAAAAVTQQATLSPYAERFARASREDRSCLARVIYHEARLEPPTGRIAIAQLVLNRTLSGIWPDTICGVAMQGAQEGRCAFAFACAKGAAEPQGDAWQQAQRTADQVLGGQAWVAGVKDAIHVHRHDEQPVWRLALQPLARIGSHIYYGQVGTSAAASALVPTIAPAATAAPAPSATTPASSPSATASDQPNRLPGWGRTPLPKAQPRPAASASASETESDWSRRVLGQ